MIARLKDKLLDPETSLPRKYRVLFALKNAKDSAEAHAALMEGLNDSSTLLRHEVAYCLGQTQNPAGIAALTKILSDKSEHPMVRHEAGEALGAISTHECIAPLEAHVSDQSAEVRETCLLALQRIRHQQASDNQQNRGHYQSVDPTPAHSQSLSIHALESVLLDENLEMFDRYKALFALRNIGSTDAVNSISKAFECSSALLKHEVAFVLGQLQSAAAFESLKTVLEDQKENPMVRHEAAEALGSIADDTSVDLLKHYAQDPEPIVAESCIVALDMLEYEQSGALEYVDAGN